MKFAFVVLLVLLAGCMQPTGTSAQRRPWVPLACDPAQVDWRGPALHQVGPLAAADATALARLDAFFQTHLEPVADKWTDSGTDSVFVDHVDNVTAY